MAKTYRFLFVFCLATITRPSLSVELQAAPEAQPEAPQAAPSEPSERATDRADVESSMLEAFNEVLTKEILSEDDYSFEDELVRKLTTESLGAIRLGEIAVDALSFDYDPTTRRVSVDFLISEPFERFASFEAVLTDWPSMMTVSVNQPPANPTLDIADVQSTGTITLHPRKLQSADAQEQGFVLDLEFDLRLAFRGKTLSLKGATKEVPGVVLSSLPLESH